MPVDQNEPDQFWMVQYALLRELDFILIRWGNNGGFQANFKDERK